MRLAAGLLFAWMVVLAPGCSRDDCKNRKMATEKIRGQFEEGPAVKCNAVLVCQYGGVKRRTELRELEDPVIIDRRSDSQNSRTCVDTVKRQQGTDDRHCDVEVSPAALCLDAAGMPDGSGPDVGGPTGGTLVTVGVGAGTGDYYFQGEGGAGGAGGCGEESGEGGQGGI
jgi:hypothetical protein